MARVEYHEVTVQELLEAWMYKQQREGHWPPYACLVTVDSVQADTVSTLFRTDNTILGFTFKMTEEK